MTTSRTIADLEPERRSMDRIDVGADHFENPSGLVGGSDDALADDPLGGVVGLGKRHRFS
ncbi:hypothetical protein SAMN05444422_101809 [Halobiforma haloterrestris]|uniref:Uncharacterized protein n=1 Tax=Natronobacterium haloterrestre TaxID=148448 RepID=A0A1I1DSS4_NATHA|nr:hypothetical protein [Halobiforma haloterrestris]SFB76078.1 hypothetical protein SAMN05444422_101809 [Halobiforma haloterrestris]